MKWIANEIARNKGHKKVTQRDIAEAIEKSERQRSEQAYSFGVLVKQKKTIAKLRKQRNVSITLRQLQDRI
jgi:hypothetical protein